MHTLLVFLTILSRAVSYGGHPDYDFSCPWEEPHALLAADGFCNPICVADIADCPASLQPDAGSVVCGDGFQYPSNGVDDPCNSTFGPIVDMCADNTLCGKTVSCRRDNISICEIFSDLMIVNIGCEEDYNYEAGEILSTSEGGFSFFPIFFTLVAVLAIAYTILNQWAFPSGKQVVVAIEKEEGKEATLETKEMETTTDDLLRSVLRDPKFNAQFLVVQTGYVVDIAGRLIFALLLLVAIMFQIGLIITTISYYAHDTPGAWQPIPNYMQGLVWFIILWHVASLYMIALLYPRHLRQVFYRRTPLKDAAFVEIWHRSQQETNLKDVGGIIVQRSYMLMEMFFKGFNFVMNTFICYQEKRLPGFSTYCPVQVNPVTGMKTMTFQLRQFVYDEKTEAFIPATVELPDTCQGLFAVRGGLSTEDAEKRLNVVGPNVIAVPPPSVLREFAKEFTRGFYIYQMFMAWTWFNFSYYHMGFILTFVFISGGLSIIWVNYNNACILATLVGSPAPVTVVRGGESKKIPSTELVPGDMVEVEPGLNTCDMVLMSGKVVLDESSLTGESMPVAKDAIENRNEKFSTHTHKKAIILAGTTTMQGDKQAEPPLAMVLSTGGNSEKGAQIRDILFRETPLFKFNYQVRIVVFILGVLAIICGIVTVFLLGNKAPEEAWFYAMYVVASAMPPLLPTVFVVSVGLSANRLLTKRVVCSEPPRLLMAGKVRVACFDKTGTLTKQGMDFYGVRPINPGNVLGEHLSEMDKVKDEKMIRAMATCQALSKITTGGVIGTAVDLKMFEASGFELISEEEVDPSGVKVRRDVVTKGSEKMSIVWRFDFDRNRMTMGVVVRDGQKYFTVFKGSAEAIMGICKEVPANFIPVGEEYASQGCYTLGICSRECTEEEAKMLSTNGVLDRAAVERNMDCLGFLTFKNEVKPESAEVVRLLREGAVRVLMITGDHPLTAVKIATELGMLPEDKPVIRATRMRSGAEDQVEWVDSAGRVVDLPENLDSAELVVNGTVFRAIQKTKLMLELLTHVRVFARMSPQDKVSVVNLYMGLGFVTSMCGDGGNDCGALRAAHVGIALSDAEASVVSPFTGVSKSPMAVVDVLLEGRCGLASAFACYKNVILYGLVETLNQMVNAYYAITFGEWCWVMLDGFWIMCTSFSLATVTPAKVLSKRRPTGSPLDIITMTACIGIFAIHCMFLGIAMGTLAAEPWYQCRKWDIGASKIGNLADIGDNYESSTIWLITGAQMLHSAAAFNFGGKHRARWINNWRLVGFLIAFYLLHLLVLFYPSHISCIYRVNCDNWNALPSVLSIHEIHPIMNPWGTTLMPVSYQVKLFFIMVANLTVACLWEYLVISGPIGEMFRRWKPRTRHLRL